MAQPSTDLSLTADSSSPEPACDTTSAFETMVRAHYGRLCAFAFRLTGSREAAEDAVHNVFLRVWQDRQRFEFQYPLAYLYRAVRNEVISERRRVGTRRRLLEQGAATGALSTAGADTSGAVERNDFARAAASAVASLPGRCRMIYTMRREQGLSYAEIAQALDITPKTVENQMSRALKLLRARLAIYLSLAVIAACSVLGGWSRPGA